MSDLLATKRLITVTGPGGSGKTRLANELALAHAHCFSAGAWFCELAPVPDATSVGFTVAERLGVKQAAGQSIIESLADWAAPRRLLIVLDNCEHVSSAAAELTATLLRRCPDLVVVATSREPLDIAGEQVWRLAPLHAGAVALFEDRAAHAGSPMSDRAAVEAICERLDHLPLAIELAAARCRFLSPAEVLDRLDRQMDVLKDRSWAKDERHATMAAAIAWSYDTLDGTEQRMLRAASVFRGGFTLEAIADITAGDVFAVADAVETLVNRSLVSVERRGVGSRYRMLEPLRQFAADRLEGEESARLPQRHAAYFTTVARRIGIGYESADHLAALELFEAEFANLRLAQQYGVNTGDLDAASALVGGIGEIAAYRMQFEVLAWFDAEQAAWSLANTGHLDQVINHIDAAVRGALAAHLDYWIIEAVASRSQIAARIGARPDIASGAGLQAIARAEAYGNQSQLTLAYALGHHAATSNAERLELLRRGVDYGQASGNLLMTAVCAYQLGDYLARDDGALHEAAGPFLLALDQLSRARVLTQIWNVLEIVAQRWADHNQLELPLIIWGCATAHNVQPITTVLPTTPTARERTNIIAAARARRDQTFSHGQRLTLDQLVAHVSTELTRTAAS
ncbi:MAG: ATP-binding protein [Acidimicrobiales bacterium]